MRDAGDLAVELELGARRDDLFGRDLPHHPRPELRVVELLDQTGDHLRLVAVGVAALGLDGFPYRAEQREVLDALRAPVGGELRRGDSPYLLVVGLEEVLVQAPAEPRRDESLEGVAVLGLAHAHPEVRRDAARRFHRPEIAQRVHRDERVVVELALVEDAALAGPAEEVLRAEDLPPQIVDGVHLGEEAVATEVETPPVTLDGPTDTADDVVGFEDRHRRRATRPSSARTRPSDRPARPRSPRRKAPDPGWSGAERRST